MRLATLKGGESAFVREVSASASQAKRLADMGFVRGARIEMIRAGNPCIVRIEDARIGLGIPHQDSIELQRLVS